MKILFTDHLPTVAAIVIVLYIALARRKNHTAAKTDRSGATYYVQVAVVRIWLNIAPLFLAFLSGLMYLQALIWQSVVFALLALGAVFIPTVIILTRDAVECHRAWGLTRRRILLSDIESVLVIDQDILVLSRSGQTIRHTKSHIAPEHFLLQLSARGQPVHRHGDF